MTKYKFLGKTVYFPEKKILAIGDLHLGYEYMFENIPKTQINQTYEDLDKILKSKIKINKIVLLGDIKHFFSYEKIEKSLFLDLMLKLTKYVKRENIVLIKGNHEKINELADKEFKPFHIEKEIAFIHGDITFPEIFDKKIETIVMGHLHPAFTLTDSQKVKSEKFKCFLVGKYKKKEVIIVPSFFPLIEGTSVNEYLNNTNCFIPAKELLKFNVYLIGDDKAFDFGKLNKYYQKD